MEIKCPKCRKGFDAGNIEPGEKKRLSCPDCKTVFEVGLRSPKTGKPSLKPSDAEEDTPTVIAIEGNMSAPVEKVEQYRKSIEERISEQEQQRTNALAQREDDFSREKYRRKIENLSLLLLYVAVFSVLAWFVVNS